MRNYLGKKTASGMPHFIISKMPKHDIYIEAFLGTGSIMKLKKKAHVNIGIEKDTNVIQKLDFEERYHIVNDNSLKILSSLIDKYSSMGSICIYLDPPYLHETRSCLHRCKYPHELNLEDHVKLLELLCTIDEEYDNVYLLLSGYKSELYMSMLHGWSYFETQTMSRGGKKIESLWCNFDPTIYIKHDYNYVGSNYTDRQRIKRKAQRWVKNLEAMPLDERMFILKEIFHSYNDLCSSIDKNTYSSCKIYYPVKYVEENKKEK